MDTEKDKISYEEALEELECIVSKLEDGELTLEASLDEFQRGIELYKYCSNILKSFNSRIKVILENENGSIEEVDFEENI